MVKVALQMGYLLSKSMNIQNFKALKLNFEDVCVQVSHVSEYYAEELICNR